MTHGSLFSGIGGFDLAAEWMGWENVFNCEINEFLSAELKRHWPNAKNYHDITTTDFSEWRGKCDVLTGGFPCQPFSGAGQRKGTEDNRYLWPQMLRAIREIHPTWIVGENVYGIINWSNGLVFETVQTDLEAEGYEVASYVLPACAVNADHRRDRVWFVAHSSKGGSVAIQPASTKGCLQESQQNPPIVFENRNERSLLKKYSRDINGIPSELDNIGHYGNAVVPQIVFQFFKVINLLNVPGS